MGSDGLHHELDLAVVLLKVHPWGEWRFVLHSRSGVVAGGIVMSCPPGARPAEAQRHALRALAREGHALPRWSWRQTCEDCWVGRPLLH